MTPAPDRPPRLGLALARWLVAPARRDELEGDLIELWQLRRQAGSRRLHLSFLGDLLSCTHGFPRRPARQDADARFARHTDERFDRLAAARWPARGLQALLQDLRYAGRLMRRQPLFAALVVTTLALGIAASTAIFTICDRVLLKPLPYPDPNQVVSLSTVPFGFSKGRMYISRDVTTLPVFSAVGLYATGGLNLGDDKTPVRMAATAATAGFFDALGVGAEVGRTFTPQEDLDVAKVAVLSSGAWRRLFGGSRTLVGQDIRLNGQPFRVVGVMPEGFEFPGHTEVWVPPASDTQLTGEAFAPDVLARMKPGVSTAQVLDALNRLNDDRRRRSPGLEPAKATVKTLHEQLAGPARPTLLFLACGVGLLLVAMCANVAGLLLSRLRQRERELLIRSAIGAGGWRLIQQLATESVVLATVGAVAGGWLALWAVRLFSASAPAFAANADLMSFDGRFLLIAFVVSVACALGFATGPAIVAIRTPSTGVLREGRTATPRSGWLRSGLVVAQIATALVLLTTTSAALGVVARLMNVELGFHNDRALVFDLTLPLARYRGDAAIVAIVDRIETRLSQVPGVTHVGTTSVTPGSTLMATGVRLGSTDEVGQPAREPEYATALAATPGYFSAIGVRVTSGRTFSDADRRGAPRVVILSESAARALWANPAAAVGRQFRTTRFGDENFRADIVGVVADVRLRGVTAPTNSQVYFPLAQNPPFGSVGVVVEAASDPARVVTAVRAALSEIDRDLPPYNITLVRDLQARYLSSQRLTLGLTGSFSAVALVLCAIGLYGVLSQLVAQRTREIGIRMALGADHVRLSLNVFGAGFRLGVAGIVIGGMAAALATRLVARFVPAVDSPSFWAIAADAAILVVVTAVAAWVPARRASSVDPLVALRSE